jgi:hypothetical protein
MGVISRKKRSMKFISKAGVWVIVKLYRITGLEWIVEEILFKVRAYRIRLNIVPTSFKWFVWTLGVISGSAGMMVYQQSPVIMSEIIAPSGTIVIVNPAVAQEIPQNAVEEKERDLADYIWLKESSRGKNNYSKCEAIGKVNGIGYAIPGDGSYMCFDSHEDEMVALNGWITVRKASGWSELKMLCTYSGNNYDECKK